MQPTLQNVYRDVIFYNLIGWRNVSAMSLEDLEKAYNGTGPEFLPAPIRQKLDSICRPFLPAVMVHDVDYTRSDGTVGSFRTTNQHLLCNCITCAMHAHPWYSWRRYALVLEACVIYRACSKFGWIVWRSAYHRNVAASATSD